MNIVEICQIKYPEELDNKKITFLTHDNVNIYLDDWSVDGVDRPTEQQILSWQNDQEFIDLVNANNKNKHNASILAQLEALDLKCIRAIRENNQEYIEMYNSQADALRAQLL